jgi:hypothetical protein
MWMPTVEKTADEGVGIVQVLETGKILDEGALMVSKQGLQPLVLARVVGEDIGRQIAPGLTALDLSGLGMLAVGVA